MTHPADFHALATDFLEESHNHLWQVNRVRLVALLNEVFRDGVAHGHRLCGAEWPVPENKPVAYPEQGCEDDDEWEVAGV